jgi:pSer/pThr/pTyr-binding forkhead associated (FHA) protein
VTELALTLIRLGFLLLLWLAVVITIMVLRRDLRAPRDARAAAATAAAAAAAQRKTPPPPKAPRPKRGAPRQLVVTDGSLKGTTIPLGAAQITIGRAPDSTLVLDDDYASSHHARLYQHEGRWVVADMGSTNGTWIDRGRITAPTVVPVGTPVRVGRTVLELRR